MEIGRSLVRRVVYNYGDWFRMISYRGPKMHINYYEILQVSLNASKEVLGYGSC